MINNGQFFTTTIDKFVRWAQKSSIWPLTFGLACCAIEMMNLVGPRYDASRFGSEVMRSSPRQADLLIVSGRLSLKMVPVIQQVRSEEHTSELQSRENLVCRLLLEKKNNRP